jgi:hypothetical protein
MISMKTRAYTASPKCPDERPGRRHTLADLCIPSRTFASVVDSLQKYGLAVVTVRPQDFAVRDELYQKKVDARYIGELELLLDKIQNTDIKIVTVGEICSQALQQSVKLYVQTMQQLAPVERKEKRLAAAKSA